MRKIYSFLATAFLASMSLTASAQIADTNEVLEGENYNLRLYKNVDFLNQKINGEEVTFTFDTSMTTDEIRFNPNSSNGYKPYRCTTEGLSNLWQAVGNIAWSSGYGLRNTGSGPRGLLLSDMKKGQVLVLSGKNGGYNTGNTPTEYNSYCIPGGSAYSANTGWAWTFYEPEQVRDISEEVHALQEIIDESTGEVDPAGDHLLYLEVLEDGWVALPLERGAALSGLQIWIDAAADEAVGVPAYTIVGVNQGGRSISFKPGESTLGANCVVWWGIAENGNHGINLRETEEIDHYEYEYELDEEGNRVLDEEGNPIIVSETPVYKLEVYQNEDGLYGDNLLEDAEDYAEVSEGDDEDGDGYVTIEAVTVSENGNASELVTFRVAVNVIQLSTPTLTLTGIEGETRYYTIGWTNNTLCGEDYNITVEYDGGEGYEEFPANSGIGEVIPVKSDITVKVEVEGYESNELTVAAIAAGIDMQQKEGFGNNQSAEHNWDFVNLTQEVLDEINGAIIDHYALLDEEGQEVKAYTVEQYNDEVDIPEDEIELLEPVVKYFGWDGLDARTAGRHWRTWIPTYGVDEDGNQVIESSVYADDQTGLFDGLVVDNSHPNYSTLAIFTNGNGLFFMSKGTITLPREILNDDDPTVVETPGLKYGEYVVVTTNGGTTVYPVEDTPEPLVINVGQSVYVYSIDIYTYDELPEAENYATGIEKLNQTAANGLVYSIDGRIVSRNASVAGLQKGLYIVNGKKILVK